MNRRFVCGHATHPQWAMAAGLVVAQLRAQLSLPGRIRSPNLGLVYLTDHFAQDAQAILDALCRELPQVGDWSGTVGIGIAATGAEYFDEPALAVMLCELPPQQHRVFSGVSPLPASKTFHAHSALVHADGQTPDLPELLSELADRTASGYLFGGLCASRGRAVQLARRAAEADRPSVLEGGLSGVAFGEGVDLRSRVTQGCQPIAHARRVSRAEGGVVLELDGEPALEVLLREAGVSLDDPARAMPILRQTLVGLSDAGADPGLAGAARRFGADVRVRHLVGLDPMRGGVAVGSGVEEGMRLAFCRRDAQAARTDLVRICAELREDFEVDALAPVGPEQVAHAHALGEPPAPPSMAGAVYISCAGRGGTHFGHPSAELRWIAHSLGDVPLVGFFAGGEIARHHLYAYTGVLTVFGSTERA